MDATECVIPANPDVAGIGIRLSIYIQAFLSTIPAILVFAECGVITMMGNDVDIVVSTSVITNPRQVAATFSHRLRGAFAREMDGILSFAYPNIFLGYALIISSIVQALTFGLSSYHAIITLNLAGIIIMSAFPNVLMYFVYGQNSHPASRKWFRSKLINFYIGLLTITSALGLWSFAIINRFDKSPTGCTSSTVYIIFRSRFYIGHPSFRHFWLAIYGILVLPAFNFVAVSVLWFLAYISIWILGSTLWILAILGVFVVVMFFVCIVLLTQALALVCIPYCHRRRSGSPGSTIDSRKGPVSVIIVMVVAMSTFTPFTAIPLFMLLSIEQTIAGNNVGAGESQWTFGQTIAILITLPPSWALVAKLRETYRTIRRANLTNSQQKLASYVVHTWRAHTSRPSGREPPESAKEDLDQGPLETS